MALDEEGPEGEVMKEYVMERQGEEMQGLAGTDAAVDALQGREIMVEVWRFAIEGLDGSEMVCGPCGVVGEGEGAQRLL